MSANETFVPVYAWQQLTEDVARLLGEPIEWMPALDSYIKRNSVGYASFDPVRDTTQAIRLAVKNHIVIRPCILHVEAYPSYYPDLKVAERYDYEDGDEMKSVRLAVCRAYIAAREQGLDL